MSFDRELLQQVKVLFEDRHLLAVFKPARIPTAKEQSGDPSLWSWVQEYVISQARPGTKGYVAPLHFIDRPVSGVVLYAKSSKAAERMSKQFRDRKIQKRYLALVEAPSHHAEPSDWIRLEHFITKDSQKNLSRIGAAEDPEAKRCLLSYRAIKGFGAYRLLEVLPVTGRSHQIRLQLSSVGTPIFGDNKYDAQESWGGQIALHAYQLSFIHPVGNQQLHITAPLPQSWLQKWPGLAHLSP